MDKHNSLFLGDVLCLVRRNERKAVGTYCWAVEREAARLALADSHRNPVCVHDRLVYAEELLPGFDEYNWDEACPKATLTAAREVIACHEQMATRISQGKLSHVIPGLGLGYEARLYGYPHLHVPIAEHIPGAESGLYGSICQQQMKTLREAWDGTCAIVIPRLGIPCFRPAERLAEYADACILRSDLEVTPLAAEIVRLHREGFTDHLLANLQLEALRDIGLTCSEKEPNQRLSKLQKHDMQAYQLSLIPKTQQQVADALNKEHGTNYHQGQVSRMIFRAKQHAEASGLAKLISQPAQPAIYVDPDLLELGQRRDSRTLRQRGRWSDED